jgi:hypothetical protein
MRKLALATLAAGAISAATLAPAEARWGRGGWHGGWGGPGLGFGLAAGALAFGAAAAASPYYYGTGYYPGPYGYYGPGPYAYYGPRYYGPGYYRPYYRPYGYW